MFRVLSNLTSSTHALHSHLLSTASPSLLPSSSLSLLFTQGVVKLILSQGVDTDCVDIRGRTALKCAAGRAVKNAIQGHLLKLQLARHSEEKESENETGWLQGLIGCCVQRS